MPQHRKDRKVRSRIMQAHYSRQRGRGLGSFLSGLAGRVMNRINPGDDTYRPGFPGEKHAILKLANGSLGKANYMGPGTAIVERLARGDPPRTYADKVSQAHDIRMSFAKTPADVAEADRKMINALKVGQAKGLDSAFNLALGKYPIQAKAAAERYGVVPYGKFHSFGDHDPAQYPQLVSKLGELAQEGLGRGKSRKKKEPKPEMPSDALKMEMIKQTVKDYKKKGMPKTVKKSRVKLVEGGAMCGSGAEAAAMMSDAPTISSSAPGSAGRTGGALKLAGQGDLKVSGFINPNAVMDGSGSSALYSTGAGLSIAGVSGMGISPTLGGVGLSLSGMPGSGYTIDGASGLFGSTSPVINAIQHKFMAGHVVPFVMKSLHKSGLVGKKYIDLVLKNPEFKRVLSTINSTVGASFDHNQLLGSGYKKMTMEANESVNPMHHGMTGISLNTAHKILPFIHMAKVMEHMEAKKSQEGGDLSSILKFGTSDIGKKLFNVLHNVATKGMNYMLNRGKDIAVEDFAAKKVKAQEDVLRKHLKSQGYSDAAIKAHIKSQSGKGYGKNVKPLANGLDFSGCGFFSSLRDSFSKLWNNTKHAMPAILKFAAPIVSAANPELAPIMGLATELSGLIK